VIIRFVHIGEIDDHNYLNCLFSNNNHSKKDKGANNDIHNSTHKTND